MTTVSRSDHVFSMWLFVQFEKPFPERLQSFRDGIIKHKISFDPMNYPGSPLSLTGLHSCWLVPEEYLVAMCLPLSLFHHCYYLDLDLEYPQKPEVLRA